jgi:U3 small nucleolar RNA-associated protein 25
MEDDFRIGISFTEKGSTKLYANFDKADLIIASPLGLRLIVGNEADKFRYLINIYIKGSSIF